MRDEHRLSAHKALACCLLHTASVAHGSAYASGMPQMTHERKRALRRRHRHASMHAWQLTHAQQLWTQMLHHPAS